MRFVAQDIRRSTTLPRPGQTFRMMLQDLLSIVNLVNRERSQLVFSSGPKYSEKPVNIDPYYLGVWLGDGDRSNTSITNKVGPGIVDWLEGYAAFPGTNSVHYHIVKNRT